MLKLYRASKYCSIYREIFSNNRGWVPDPNFPTKDDYIIPVCLSDADNCFYDKWISDKFHIPIIIFHNFRIQQFTEVNFII